jgi:FtsP/CotA-like multicopper oxidase with cupredoxin domain
MNHQSSTTESRLLAIFMRLGSIKLHDSLHLMPMKHWVFILLIFPLGLRAQEVVDLYIVEGKVSNDIYEMPFFTFNTRDQFDSSNAVLRFEPGDVVTFRVTNHADFTCGFRIESYGKIDAIAMGETEELTVTLDQSGTFLYEDHIGDHRALGLGGMLVVSDFNGPEFYAVFTEHNRDWIDAIADGGSYDRTDYHPTAFTINGFGFPRTLTDSLSFIEGQVGQTIRVHMTNAGMMHHFPHWHGYHVRIVEASKQLHYVGRLKDSYGMMPGESVTVELIPDKPGMFPVHNHNLVTTTIGGNYPGGMMMHMHIHP